MLKRSCSASIQFNTLSSFLLQLHTFFFFFFFFSLFLFQRTFCFLFSTSFLLSLFSVCFSFLQTCCPLFFNPKYLFFQLKMFLLQPKTFFSPKRFSPKNLSLFVVQRLLLFFLFSGSFLSFNVLPFSPSLVQPSIFKAIKKSSFGSVYPRPSILSSCFTSLLFE